MLSGALLDTNVAIAITDGVFDARTLVSFSGLYVSIITRIELLGFRFKTELHQQEAFAILSQCSEIGLTELIAEETIQIRKQHRLLLPDAIIAATARLHNLVLLTADKRGFPAVLPPAQLVNPFTSLA